MKDSVKEFINQQEKWYDKQASKNKFFHTLITLTKLSLSTSISIFSLSMSDTSWQNYVVAILGAVITILTGVQATFHFKDNWLKYRHSSYNLRFEQLLHKNNAPPYGKNERYLQIINHIKAVMDSEHAQWLEEHSDEDNLQL